MIPDGIKIYEMEEPYRPLATLSKTLAIGNRRQSLSQMPACPALSIMQR